MSGLIWFGQITGDTPIRDIGWTYVVLLAGFAFIAACIHWLWRNW